MKFSAVLLLGLLLVVTHPSTQKQIAPRIIGGSDARAAQFPFAAAIYVDTEVATTFCGGALLSNRWVLTAAHCISGAIRTTILLGSTTLSGSDPNRATLVTDTLVIHPDYNPDTLENDLGLLEFRLPVTLSDYIKPISFLPIADLPGSDRTTTFGWGQINDQTAGVTNTLQFVQLVTLANEECQLVYGSQIRDSMVCASGNFNEGICRGDSGSPLIQNVGNGNTLIVGVASFMSTFGCENTDPSGYTRVFPQKQWITDVTGIR